jgi:hypothetical protein
MKKIWKRLASQVDRDRLCEFEGERSLRWKFDVFLPDEKSCCRSGSCSDRPADQGTFAASCEGTDQ